MNLPKLSNIFHYIFTGVIVLIFMAVNINYIPYFSASFISTIEGFLAFTIIGKGTELDTHVEDRMVNRKYSFRAAVDSFGWDECVQDIVRNAIGAITAFGILIFLHLMRVI